MKKTVYGATRIRGTKQCGGGPSGGIVKKHGAWWVWHPEWFREASHLKIFDGLQVIYQIPAEGGEYVKVELKNYDLKDHEYYADDFEEILIQMILAILAMKVITRKLKQKKKNVKMRMT